MGEGNYISFLEDLEKKFPIPQPYIYETEDFSKKLDDVLNEFEAFCGGFGVFNCEGIHVDTKIIISKLSKTIITSIKEYLWGSTNSAHQQFLEGFKNDKILQLFDEQLFLEKPIHLFKLRKNENHPFQKNEIFHISYQERRKSSTCRFSIPGTPTLYLGDSLKLCYEEVRKEKFNLMDYSASIFCTKMPYKIIEMLRPVDFKKKFIANRYNSLYLSRYIAVFPLILACTFQTSPPHDHTFKPEYIIPQMFMDFVKNNSKIHGVKYPSTRFKYTHDFKPYNYAFPTKNRINEDGYCTKLKELFDWSEPVRLADYKMEYELFETKLFQENNEMTIEADKKFESMRKAFGSVINK